MILRSVGTAFRAVAKSLGVTPHSPISSKMSISAAASLALLVMVNQVLHAADRFCTGAAGAGRRRVLRSVEAGVPERREAGRILFHVLHGPGSFGRQLANMRPPRCAVLTAHLTQGSYCRCGRPHGRRLPGGQRRRSQRGGMQSVFRQSGGIGQGSVVDFGLDDVLPDLLPVLGERPLVHLTTLRPVIARSRRVSAPPTFNWRTSEGGRLNDRQTSSARKSTKPSPTLQTDETDVQ